MLPGCCNQCHSLCAPSAVLYISSVVIDSGAFPLVAVLVPVLGGKQ